MPEDSSRKQKLDALIALGGDDTQSISVELIKRGVPCVGVPKTIDNDLSGTDVCFGFDTAVTIATEAVDRLHSTTESHSRVQVVEVMGRDAGWIAVTAGIAGGADVILAPEKADRHRRRRPPGEGALRERASGSPSSSSPKARSCRTSRAR